MKITGTTQAIGIIGYPVEHSLSPLMHNAAFAHCGLDFNYTPFAVEPQQLGQAMAGLKALNLRGFNVTIPHKEQVLSYLDLVSDEARQIGAVNTVVRQEHGLVGYNTDGIGFVESMRQLAQIDPAGLRVVMLGAGGAARAVAVALAKAGIAELKILNRTVDKAQALARDVQRITGTPTCGEIWQEENLRQALSGADVIINTSPVGMYPHHQTPSVVPAAYLQPHQLVCDLIYNPLETTLLQEARLAGCQVLPGWGMLLYQGAVAFKLWTGVEAPVEIMQKVLLDELHERFRK